MAFLLQTGTALHETDGTFVFALRGRDVVAIKKRGTDTGTTEIHILSADDNYQSFLLQTSTGLHETDDGWAFLMRGRDLVAIKKRNTDSQSTEVHILSEASNYQQFILQTATPLHETDDTFDFVMRGRDLVAIKKSNTGTGTTELHVLSAASNYQQFVTQSGTALHETDGTWAFSARGRDIVAIKRSGTGTCTTEAHVLSAASGYQQFSLQTGTVLHETDDTFAFAMTFDALIPNSDNLMAIKKSGTGSNSTEVHVLTLDGFQNVAPPFLLHTGTPLHETDETFAFTSIANNLVPFNNDIVAIKKSGTGTNSTEVHRLAGVSNYQSFVLQTGTALHETDGTWAFAMRGSDLVGIKKRGTDTSRTEVHILSAASNYQQFILQTGTALPETDDTVAFAMRGQDLVAIFRSGTASESTEVHVLSAASNYQQFLLQTATPLPETDGTVAFLMRDLDLVAIKKTGTASNMTELHVLTGASNYQEFSLQTDSPLHETDDTWSFVLTQFGAIAGVKQSGTDSGSTELHVFEIGVHNDGLGEEEVEFDLSECIFDSTAAFLQRGCHIQVRIELDWDDEIPDNLRTMLRDRWATGIVSAWSGQFACCLDSCCGRKRPVTFEVQWTSDDPHHVICVETGRGQTNARTWYVADSGAVAAHEFGHLIGFHDEYMDSRCPNRSPVNTGTIMDDTSGVVARLIQPFCDRHRLRLSTP